MSTGGEGSRSWGRDLHNIPFIHKTKRTSTEPLSSRLEVGSTGKGGEPGTSRGKEGSSLKKNTEKYWPSPHLGILGWGGGLGLLQLKRNENIQGGLGRPEGEGGQGLGEVWQVGEGIALPLLGFPLAPGVWQEGGSPSRGAGGGTLTRASPPGRSRHCPPASLPGCSGPSPPHNNWLVIRA